jgi:Amt family ammonium transporter
MHLQFNAGSALTSGAMASHVFMTTNAAAGSAMLAWLLLDHLRGHKIRATGACVGAVIGLVGITPAAGVLDDDSADFTAVWAQHITADSSVGSTQQSTERRQQYCNLV